MAFRAYETKVIQSIATIRNHVVVSGAGAIERTENWEVFQSLGPIVWLATPVNEIARRLLKRPDEISLRPMLRPVWEIDDREEKENFLIDKLNEMMERRRHRYEDADIELSCSYVTAETCASVSSLKTHARN